MKPMDLTGQRFGRLVAIKRVSRKPYTLWACRCDCGNNTVVRLGHLRAGATQSCGCLVRETSTTHGQWGTPEYNAWNTMKQRCLNPNNPRWHQYGGRGITVCEQWLPFENFIADMGQKPSPEHSLDRIDNESGYRPDNCRWATRSEQCRNSRASYNSIAAKCRARGITYATVKDRRRKGWTLRQALNTPSFCNPHTLQPSQRQMARDHGLAIGTLRKRLELGWSLEKALNTPVNR